MRFLLKIGLLAILCFLLLPATVLAATPAFPTAEGGGKNTLGGRGGVVYEVTNLNDSGEGSLRKAVEAYGPRTIVFRVSGTIKLKSPLKIQNSFLTIAGQTAPGDGICISDYEVKIDANDIILRYLRFRLGDETGVDTDAIWGRYRRRIMIDHCSAGWSVDESMSIYGMDSSTVQWCIISESLYDSNHPKGTHGYGGIWGGKNTTFHHNLLAHHSSRNPRFAGGETPACENLDFRNNVIYNWGFNSAYGGEAGKINIVNNYYKAGPATKSSVRNRIVETSDTKGRWYVAGNTVEGYPAITTDNWAGGVQGTYGYAAYVKSDTLFPFTPIIEQSAEEAYEAVLLNAGATLPVRDPIDIRIVAEVRGGYATYDGNGYEQKQNLDTSVVRGIIDSQTDVGGWPQLVSLDPPVDDDHDGMPNTWETSQGLDPNDDSDRNLLNHDGYTMLEVYLNSITGPAVEIFAEEINVPQDFALLPNYPNPFNPTTQLRFSTHQYGKITVKIYDIQGRQIRNLYRAHHQPGYYSLTWNGLNDAGLPVGSGLYFASFNFQNQYKTIKMQLIK
ncbi:MAG: T9SS type A sorting domain-containing protein [Candidatus Marinimicrobia bacterium]|nr:T9SS type A sorting domain-containing protein [Candidatus Neomarinimicrobiota bacterium]